MKPPRRTCFTCGAPASRYSLKASNNAFCSRKCYIEARHKKTIPVKKYTHSQDEFNLRSPDEIAEILNARGVKIKPKTVKAMLHKAHTKIKRQLALQGIDAKNFMRLLIAA